MFNAKNLLRHVVLALALAGSPLAAFAGPASLHVDLDTRTLAGPAYLDLQFGALTTAPPTTVTFSNFRGTLGAVDYAEGAVVFNADGSVTLGNLPDFGSLLSFNATFGGKLGFDLLFSDDHASAAGTDGSTLTVALLDASMAPIGGSYGVALFELTPGSGLSSTVNGQFAAIGPVVAAVPEPGNWMLMGTGLALLGFAARRRQAR
jgi:hypothetical protein